MSILFAAAVGVAAALGLSLVLKLRAIRTRGFGEGSRLELAGSGLAFRYPHWWKLAGDRVSSPERETVSLRTGHSRGLLRVAAWPSIDPEPPLAESLAAVLREQGLDLDDPEIQTARSPVARVWVASGGRQASRPEERSYFEAHLASVGGARVLFFYTNSVLQGFLDAYYLEKVLETLETARSAT